MYHRPRLLGFTVLLGLSLSTFAPSTALALPFSFSSGDLSASADFTLSGSTLTVVLSNTSAADVQNPSQVLTAVFFDSNGTLTSVSAVLTDYGLPGGSTVFFGPDGGGNVGGEWGYASGLSGAPNGATQGISSAGFGLFGGSTFGGSNLEGPDALNGLNYGLTSAGDNSALGNAAVTGQFPLIQHSVTFTFAVSDGFTLDNVGNVTFQYGTALTEPSHRVPEPSAILLLGMGILAFGLWGLRKPSLT